VYRDYVDISIAVATPKGLVVPVLRNADDLDFADVERVGARARARGSRPALPFVRGSLGFSTGRPGLRPSAAAAPRAPPLPPVPCLGPGQARPIGALAHA
jgi:2-oxoglutarate dehydrogenase E2 component (dihydrolipoamide succinyltransferase)